MHTAAWCQYFSTIMTWLRLPIAQSRIGSSIESENPAPSSISLQQFITSVTGHLGREIPTQLIFYLINESH